jgi:hypothetical protein
MADLAADTDTVDTDDTTTDTTADTSTDTTTDNAADTAADKGGGGDTTADDAPDWRVQLAGDDAKLLTFLGRYQSPKAFVEAAKKDRENTRNGFKPLSEDPSESELQAYRKNFSVPEAPEGYLEKLSNGLVVGDDDRPIVDKFLTAMHGANAPAAVTDAALQAYYQIVAEQDASIAERVSAATQATEDELREDWGGDYRRNSNALDSYIETLPAEVQSFLNEGFGPDGIPRKGNAAVSRWLAGLALEANPLATVVPGTGTNAATAIADEIADLEGMMGNRNSEYWKGPKAAKHQARYLELVSARDKLAAQ